MKKIISIILAIIAIFTMSITSFAAVTAETPADKYVSAVVILGDQTPTTFKSVVENGKEIEKVAGYETTFIIKLANKTDNPIKWEDVLGDFDIVVKTGKDDKVKTIDTFYGTPNWTEGGDALGNYINPNTPWGHDFKMNIITDEDVDVWFEIVLGGKTQKIEAVGEMVEFKLIITEDIPSTEATPNEPSTEDEPEALPPVNDKVEDDAETVDPTPDTVIPSDKEEAPEDDYVAPDVEVEIPDTGAAVPVGAIGTLIGSAVAAVIAKKKKEN